MAESGIRLKRHFEELSPKKEDEVVGTVADLILNYLKARSKDSNQPAELNAPAQAGQTETIQEVTHERDADQRPGERG